MNRLIDADALKESFRKQTVNVQGKIKDDADAIIEAICKDIDLAPTVDAVRVVRCRECKHHEVCKNGVNGWCNEHERPTDVTYFCADGERD
jgi:hypothetical protein